MFLDDKLYASVKAYSGTETEDVQKLFATLIQTCEDHWRPFVYPEMPKKGMKTHWDRAFNSWDNFARRLKKDGDEISVMWADLFEKHSYKKAFFEDDTFSKLYKECS